jgi:ATP-dependent RNA helicase SUPV3L1/SUV3
MAQELSRIASARVDAMLQDQNAAARKRQPKRWR